MLDGMATTGEPWRLGRRPALDGLRGIAVMLVVACHVTDAHRFFGAGAAGVSMFFALSGFLITSLLLEELRIGGRLHLTNFYRRRALRLLPALVVMLAFIAVMGETDWRIFAIALAYVGNWFAAAGYGLGPIEHIWSLAIEEQFYIVWPVLLTFLWRFGRTRALMVTAVGAVASVALRFSLFDGTRPSLSRVYNGTDTRADVLLIGCALALLMVGRSDGRARCRLGGCLALVPALFFAASTGVTVLATPTLVALATAGAIWCVARGSYAGFLSSPVLVWFGRRSYGLYLWHVPILELIGNARFPHLVQAVVVVAVSLVATEMSWRHIERPFQKLKDRPRLSQEAPGPAAEPALLGGRRGPVPTTATNAEPVTARV